MKDSYYLHARSTTITSSSSSVRSSHDCHFVYPATITLRILSVSVPLAMRPSLTRTWTWLHMDLSGCCTHEGETDTDELAQDSVDSEELKNCPSPSCAQVLNLGQWVCSSVC